MEHLTDEEIEFIKRNVVLIKNEQVTKILQDIIHREMDLIKKVSPEDKDMREFLLWNVIGLMSAIMQLRPGGWADEGIEIIPELIDHNPNNDAKISNR